MARSDSVAGAAALRALRQRRGLSLAGCARALLEQARLLAHPPSRLPTTAGLMRSLSRWEHHSAPVLPSERHQLLLAHLYARTPAGSPALGPGSDFSELLLALACMGAGAAQLRLLRENVTRTLTSSGIALHVLLPSAVQAALGDPARLDEEVAAQLATAVSQVRDQLDRLPFARLQLMLAPIVEASRQLLAGPVPERLVPELHTAAVSVFCLAGRLAFETHDDAAARAHFAEATRQARLLPAGSPWRPLVHLDHALVALHSSAGAGTARQLAQAAAREAHHCPDPAVRAWANGWLASLAARCGDHRAAATALHRAAHDTHSPADDTPVGPAGLVFGPQHLTGFEAVCRLYTGQPRTAYDDLSTVPHTAADTRGQAQHAIVLTQRATALVRAGEPRSAAELLHHSLDTAPPHTSRITTRRIQWAWHELTPWQTEPFVTQLGNRLLTTLL
ncbi:hypothetical protein ACFP1Z_32780 [Streptomyces gamaensis]|uniref:XRE family transcriptional regulator n=1 Tax=Streptomyces gamaensis TaxID=1763542 RepID=A0ABW0Z8A7_9ACTN